MGKRREAAKTEALIKIFQENLSTTVHDAKNMVHCTSSHACDVKAWVKKGCVGPLRESRIPKKKQKKEDTVKVPCLGPWFSRTHYLESEYRCVGDRKIPLSRLCPSCARRNEALL